MLRLARTIVRTATPRHEAAAVIGLLALFVAAGANSLPRDSATFDETAHLPAGYTYLDRADFRLNPEHPPLSKAWAALPLWIARSPRVDYRSPFWNGQGRSSDGHRTGADQWRFGYEFLNGDLEHSQRRDPMELLVPARLAMLVPGVLLGLIAWLWSRELWGPAGGLLTLFLYCLSPTMLAHTRLVTTDLPAAAGFVGVLFTFWRFCRSPRWSRLAAFAVCLVLALLTKFSSLLLGPVLLLLSAMWCLRRDGAPAGSPSRASRLLWVAAAGGIALVASYVGIWAAYGLRFDAAADPGYRLNWDVVGLRSGAGAEALRAAIRGRLLPEAYLYGLAYFLGGAARRVAFLNGQTSVTGWWYYFPQAFLMKTPPASLLALAALATGALRRARWRSWDGWFVVVPAMVYVGASIVGNLNIGHRHLAPLYPLLFVLLGRLPGWVRARGGATPWMLALLLAYAVSFLAATPRYLSYFNVSAGGSAGGWRYLLDSNVDWGQDLMRLREWMQDHRLPTIHLAYFGTGDPAAYGVRVHKVYRVHDFHPERPAVRPGPGDHVAISVNLLQGLYFDEDRHLAEELLSRGWITPTQVREWADVRDRASRRRGDFPTLGSWLIENGLIDESQHRSARDRLIVSWFEHLRDELTPVGRVGDSIVVYRLP